MWIWESTICIRYPSGLVFFPAPFRPVIGPSGCGGVGRLVQRGLCGCGDRLKSLGLADRDIGQDLAVEVEPGQFDPVHELRVCQPVLPRTGIDPLDPQGSEIALAVAPVAISVAQRLL